MAARDVLKNFNAYVDGKGYAGQVSSYTPPALTLVIDDHRAGGMDAPAALDMGMEAMEASVELTSYDRDILALFGVAEGNQVPFSVRGVLESYDGTTTAVRHDMRGKITSMDSGTWTPGEKGAMTVTFRLDYYKCTHGGQVVHEIDVQNMVRIINGVDRLAEQRAALGL